MIAYPLFKSIIFRGAAVLLSIIFSVVIARNYSPADAGIVFLCQTILLGLSIFARHGTDNVILKYGSIAWSKKNLQGFSWLIVRALKLTALYALALALVLSLFTPVLFKSIFKMDEPIYLYLTAATLIPFTLISICVAYLKTTERAPLANFVEAGAPQGLAAVLIFLYSTFATLTVEAALICLFMAFFTTTFYLVVKNKNLIFRKNRINPTEGNLLTIERTMFLIQFLTFITFWSSPVYISIFSGNTDVAYYNAAYRCASIISFILLVVDSLASPQIATLYAKNQHKDLQTLISSVIFLMALITVPLFVFFCMAPSYLMSTLFGAEFSNAAKLLMVLSLGQIINVLTGPVSFLLVMTGHENFMKKNTIFVAITSISLNLILIPHYGAWGAALVTATCLVLQNVIAAVYAYKVIGIKSFPMFRMDVKGLFLLLKNNN